MNNLVIGGCGFIGTNLVKRLLSKNQQVTILDNLSRKNTDVNLKWLEENFPNKFKFVKANISKDQNALNNAVKNMDRIFHLAGQVAVTTSVNDPRMDFESNALGTFNVLEAVRLNAPDASLIYSSTNKVYGGMEDTKVKEGTIRYDYEDLPQGVSEDFPLDFHSPYGCSKGAGDQYVRDYARIYNLNTVVFRQSCIYGPHQWGVEDQGWVAWFIIALLRGTPLTIFGDGKQVRDILYVDDLLDAYEVVLENISETKGEVYNVGGGLENSISIWYEFKPILENLFNKEVTASFSDWRPGDQRIFVCDTSKLKNALKWEAKTTPGEGIEKLYNWVQDNIELYK